MISFGLIKQQQFKQLIQKILDLVPEEAALPLAPGQGSSDMWETHVGSARDALGCRRTSARVALASGRKLKMEKRHRHFGWR